MAEVPTDAELLVFARNMGMMTATVKTLAIVTSTSTIATAMETGEGSVGCDTSGGGGDSVGSGTGGDNDGMFGDVNSGCAIDGVEDIIDNGGDSGVDDESGSCDGDKVRDVHDRCRIRYSGVWRRQPR